ncbi:MAG: RDD family protein [Rhizobiaceae bacterium]|nr:RDD family protein [Rhizobiaceae bacterium]MCO5072507.1 RDD family protein [Rhizobiaceae bacterium]
MTTRILEGQISGTRLDDMRAYEGVRSRRVLAFIIDYIIVGLLLIPVAVFVLLFGLLTFGLGWMLFGILVPAVALTYIWWTMGGRKQATIGMQIVGIRLDRLDGQPIDGLFAVVHSVLFWAGNALLTPLILLVTLFTDRKRALHDLLLGTVVTRSDVI